MDFFISEHLHRALCAPVHGKPERMCNCGMSSEHLVGTSIPRFTFDTPTRPGNDFYALCEGEQPLVMIFLPAGRPAGLRSALLGPDGGTGHPGG